MNLFQFTQIIQTKGTTKRVFAVVGESGYLCEDALQLILDKAERFFGACRPIFYRLSEIAEAPQQISCVSGYNVRVVRWEPNLVLEGDAERLFRGLAHIPKSFSIIVDTSGEVLPVFKRTFAKGVKSSFGTWITCDEGVWSRKRLAKVRLWALSRLGLPGRAFLQIEDRLSLEETYNLVHILEYLVRSTPESKWTQPSLRQLEGLGLLLGGLEGVWAHILVHDNKWIFLKRHYRKGQRIDAVKFFNAVFRELVRLLKLKTVRGKTTRERMEELSIYDKDEFDEYVITADNQSYADLYRRFKLTLQISRWRLWQGSIPLLLLYW